MMVDLCATLRTFPTIALAVDRHSPLWNHNVACGTTTQVKEPHALRLHVPRPQPDVVDLVQEGKVFVFDGETGLGGATGIFVRVF